MDMQDLLKLINNDKNPNSSSMNENPLAGLTPSSSPIIQRNPAKIKTVDNFKEDDEDNTEEPKQITKSAQSSNEQDEEENQEEQPSNKEKLTSSINSNSEDLKNAMNRRDYSQMINNLARGSGLIGAGIAARSGGGAQLYNKDLLNELDKQAEQPVSDIGKLNEQKIKSAESGIKIQDLTNKADRNDPESDISEAYRNLLFKAYPQYKNMEGSDGLTAEGVKELQPIIDTKIKADTLSSNRALAQNAKQEQINEKEVHKLSDALDPNKARGGNLAQTQARVNAAERVEALFKQFPDGNIPPQQTRELATSVASLLSSGASGQAVSQINELVPHTMHGDAAKIAQWVTGNPTGSGQQSFMKMLQDTTAREKEVAQGQVKQAQLQRIAQFRKLKEVAPEDFNNTVQSYGLDPDEVDNYLHGKTSKNPGRGIANQQSSSKYQPGQVIQYQGKNYKVGPDGDTLIPM